MSAPSYFPWELAHRAAAPCVRDDHTELDYASFAARVDAAAEQFDALGVRRGDVVATFLPNRVELLIAIAAAWRLGAIATPVNPAFTAAEAELWPTLLRVACVRFWLSRLIAAQTFAGQDVLIHDPGEFEKRLRAVIDDLPLPSGGPIVPAERVIEAAREQAPGRGLPPVHLWNPAHSGEIDIVIERDGSWRHEGAPIQREALVRLFSTVLRRDDDGIYLVTPAEKLKITVEDAPFIAVRVDAEPGRLRFLTNVGDEVIAGPEHAIEVKTDPETGEPAPYLHVRRGLTARIARPAFYELVELAEEFDRLDLRDVFEAITDAGAREKDIVLLTELVRAALRRQISDQLSGPSRTLTAVLAHPELEDSLRQSVRAGANGGQIAIDPEVFRRVGAELHELRGRLGVEWGSLVLLSSMDVRRHLRRLIENEFFELPVLSFQELVGDLQVIPKGQLHG